MALGLAQAQDRFESPRELLGDRLRQGSIYRLLADEGARIFADDYFADLYSASARGRPTVPARILATVMVLQAFEGLSDREACDRLGGRPALAGGCRSGDRGRGLPPDGAPRPAQPPAGFGPSPAPLRGHQGRRQPRRGNGQPGPGPRLHPDL